MQLVIKYMKEMIVYTPCEHEAVKERGLTPIGTRWVFTNTGDTEHPFIRARLVVQETKKTTKMGLTDTSMTSAATPPVEGFRFLLSRAMTGEKKGTHRTSWSLDSSTSRERTFIRWSAERWRFECMVIRHAHQELPRSTAQCTERRTRHSALICTVNGRWRNWITTLKCSTRVCTNILSKTSVYSDTATILRHLQHELRLLNSRKT